MVRCITCYSKNMLKIFFLILLVAPSVCFSQSMKFISLEVAPWSYRSDGEYVGIFPDIIKEIERRTGHQIKITMSSFSFARINREMMLGRQDCTIVVEDKARDEFVVVGETLFNHAMGVVAKKQYSLKKYSDLYGLVISTNERLMISQEFFSDGNLKKEFDTSYDVGLKKIKHGRIDAVAGALSTIKYLAKKNNMLENLGEPLVLKSEPVTLQCSKKSKNLEYMKDVNSAIKLIKADGTLKKIIDRNV